MDPIVSTTWLAERLHDPSLRVFDTVFDYDDDTGELISGRVSYERGHIPGAGFLDQTAELTDASADVLLTRPSPRHLSAILGEGGVSRDSHVVLYSSDHLMCATRVWWMLHSLGLSKIAVLDGGLAAWAAEGRPIETGRRTYPSADLRPEHHEDVWADMARVSLGLAEDDVAVVCALGPLTYAGTGPSDYGRPGHISGSVNVPHSEIIDPDTNRFRSRDEMRRAFASRGVLTARKVITYCGGGVAATVDAFALRLLGHDDVTVYDGSLLEWAARPEMPMTMGPEP